MLSLKLTGHKNDRGDLRELDQKINHLLSFGPLVHRIGAISSTQSAPVNFLVRDLSRALRVSSLLSQSLAAGRNLVRRGDEL